MSLRILRLFPVLISAILLWSCNPDPNSIKSDKSNQSISVAVDSDVETLDPRLARSANTVTLEHMLFEGLLRKNYAGRVVPALAEEFSASSDGRTYTFTLRESYWSDGSPVTAEDFEYAWKGMLDPHFPAPNAYQLYVIKGAKAAKSGDGGLKDVGIKALNDKTLEVVLEEPTPYFLELLTTHFYSPINRQWASQVEAHSAVNWSEMPTNGPFLYSEWRPGDEISVVKNPNYWDSEKVRLEKVSFVITDESTALQMFERGELDWVGSPMSFIPSDAVTTLRKQKRLIITPADGTHFFRINTGSPLLQNANIRKALAYAIDRQAIVTHVTQAAQPAATGLVPLHAGIQDRPHFKDHDVPTAWTHFQEGLKELGVSKDDIPTITLCYASQERSHKIAQAVQQQWKSALDIDVALESCERSVLIEKLNQHDYNMVMGSWFGDISDPINFLEVFKYRETSTNHTLWENDEYIALLDKSSVENDPIIRKDLLARAERILVDEMPIIPLYHATFNHLSRDVVGVYFSSLGYLDFTYAFKGASDK